MSAGFPGRFQPERIARRFPINPGGSCAMSSSHPDSLSIQLIARCLVLGGWWLVAWGLSWLFGSNIVFYVVGVLGTVISIQGIVREYRFQRSKY